jgi:pyruvate ferredoxin oxidoreductase beta subunit
VATVIGSEPLDLARKVEKAAKLSGPRFILALSPCPTGWEYDPSKSVEIGRLAVQTGVWPLKEYIDGEVHHTKPPRKRVPVEQYLELQGRFRHLFEPVRQQALLDEIQARVDAYWDAATPAGSHG